MSIALIYFFACFVQGAAGFGMALVAMPLLASVLGLGVAAPLMSLVGSTAGVILIVRYRDALNLHAVTRLTLAGVMGVPLGVLLLSRVDKTLFTRGLGVFLIIYALYALFSPHLPELSHRRWGYLFGFLGGLTSGAYAIPGPPVLVYATCRRWHGPAFKSNLQTFFLITGFVLLFTHLASGNVTPQVWRNYLLALPGMVVGLAAGFSLDRFLDAARFRRLVLILLIGLGLKLLLG
jgi:hypothetical protein